LRRTGLCLFHKYDHYVPTLGGDLLVTLLEASADVRSEVTLQHLKCKVLQCCQVMVDVQLWNLHSSLAPEASNVADVAMSSPTAHTTLESSDYDDFPLSVVREEYQEEYREEEREKQAKAKRLSVDQHSIQPNNDEAIEKRDLESIAKLKSDLARIKGLNVQRKRFVQVAVCSLKQSRYKHLVDEIFTAMVNCQKTCDSKESKQLSQMNQEIISHIINTGVLLHSSRKDLDSERHTTVLMMLDPFLHSRDKVSSELLARGLINDLRLTESNWAKFKAFLAKIPIIQKIGFPNSKQLAAQREMLLDFLATLYESLAPHDVAPQAPAEMFEPPARLHVKKLKAEAQREQLALYDLPTMEPNDLKYLTSRCGPQASHKLRAQDIEPQCLPYMYKILTQYALHTASGVPADLAKQTLVHLLTPDVMAQEMTEERHQPYINLLISYMHEFEGFNGPEIFVQVGGMNVVFGALVRSLSRNPDMSRVVPRKDQRGSNDLWEILSLLRLCLALIKEKETKQHQDKETKQRAAFLTSTLCKLVVHTCCRIVLSFRIDAAKSGSLHRKDQLRNSLEAMRTTESMGTPTTGTPSTSTPTNPTTSTPTDTPTTDTPTTDKTTNPPTRPSNVRVKAIRHQPLDLSVDLIRTITAGSVYLHKKKTGLKYKYLYAPFTSGQVLDQVFGFQLSEIQLEEIEELEKQFAVPWWQTPFEKKID